MTWEGDVYQGDRLAARIERTKLGSRMVFDPEFLANPPSFPGFLGARLPYSYQPIEQVGDNLHPFFSNLLPEGTRLQMLFDQNKIAKDDFLGMLLKVGWDTIGDVAVLPHGENPVRHRAAIPTRDLSEISFWDAFRTGAGRNPDAAIPGVQAKISAATIAFPVRGLGTSAGILKLNPDTYPLVVQNEHVFLNLARRCGLQAAKARIVKDREGELGLWVDRFDRIRLNKVVTKLHQEDICQLTQTTPANKYHITLREVVDVIREVCTAPIVEIQRLLLLYAFSYLTGNADLHAKNVSILWSNGSARLSPAYDVPSSLPYDLQPNMAMKMDGKDLNFKAADFERFFTRFELPSSVAKATLNRLCEKLMVNLSALDDIGFDEKQTAAMKAEIANRCSALSS